MREYLGAEYLTELGYYGKMMGGELEGLELGESGTEVGSSGEISGRELEGAALG